ncbi:MAG: hypothetical protein R2864_10875 [Syntrophotaleaceae bacterium]
MTTTSAPKQAPLAEIDLVAGQSDVAGIGQKGRRVDQAEQAGHLQYLTQRLVEVGNYLRRDDALGR